MQKKLIALAVAGLIASPVFAQSSVQIYGRVDASYVYKTNDNKATLEDDESTSRLGLLGEEDLGGGLKAFFQLEERFNLDAGTAKSALRWEDKSWVGLRSATIGEFLFGRAPTALDSIYGGGVAEAFGGDTISQFGSRRASYTGRYNNAVRYTSPAFGGVKLIAHYALTETSGVKVPFGFAASGTWGPVTVEGGWQKDTTSLNGTSAGTHFKTWLVDGSYDFGVAKVFGGYAHSKGYNDYVQDNHLAKNVRYQVGTIVPVGGAGTIRANVGRGRATDAAGVKGNAYTHVGLGYWYGLSKRTTLMANASFDKQKDAYSDLADNQTGLQFALRHEF